MNEILMDEVSSIRRELPVTRTFVPATETHLVNAKCSAGESLENNFLLRGAVSEVKVIEEELYLKLSKMIDRKIHQECVECPYKQMEFVKEAVLAYDAQRWSLHARCQLSTCNRNGRGSVFKVDDGALSKMIRELESKKKNKVIGSW